ncbi:type IV secretory system conjugative DNA transfer family protein [Sphingomonas sp. PAMC 26621]|uniref:type IV secretory system conjugative DNA transfer family protein n=1 Tax=Sphingomonas sp. PAMC 26621 TaxID=1112213 RepID=UPI001EE65B13|nr:type IV secretory system conjugative DNA transfer family protein [Sphingomonas sp. PAMC 26621]
MRARFLLLAGGIALSSLSAAHADVPRCDLALTRAHLFQGSEPDVKARYDEYARAICAAQDASTDRWSRVVSDLHLNATGMIAAANAKNWTGVADGLDRATPLLDQMVTQAKADTAQPHNVQEPVETRLEGFLRLATDGYRTRLVQAGLPPPASLHAGLADLSRALRTRGSGQLATTAYVLVMDLAGNADDLAGVFSDEAARQERHRQEELNTKLSDVYAERENPTTATGYWTGIGQRLGHWPALFSWMLIAAIVGSIIALRMKRRRIAWKLVALTPAIFLPMLLIHGFLPIIPWWALDVGALVVLAALWGYTERFRVLYTGRAPFGSQETAPTAVGAPVGLTGPSDGQDTHGSAYWGSTAQMRALRHLPAANTPSPAGFALGRATDRLPGDNRFRQNGHVITFAPTGSGKGTGLVIPTLLEYPGSALVLDVKGENYAVTARARRAMGQAVWLLDPYGVTGDRAHGFNWLDRIDLESEDCLAQAMTIADACVIPADKGGDDHWDDTARDLIRGVVLHVAGMDADKRNMGEVRRLLASGAEELDDTLAAMMVSDAAFGIVARAANTFSGMADRERGSVLSSARRHTAFLDDPRIARTLARSDFALRDLKHTPMTVYVVLPADKLRGGNARFVRGLVNDALAGVMADTVTPFHKVAFLLDEFAQLGRMTAIEDAISLVRGFGVALWLFLQDMDQLKIYPKKGSFLANATGQFFNTNDLETAKYVSDMLGKATIEYETANRGKSGGTNLGTGSHSMNRGKSTGASQQFAGRELLTPDEVMREQRAIVFVASEPAWLLDRIDYRTDAEYRGHFDPNPYHVGPRA